MIRHKKSIGYGGEIADEKIVSPPESCEFRYFNDFQTVLFCRMGHFVHDHQCIGRFSDPDRDSVYETVFRFQKSSNGFVATAWSGSRPLIAY